jgi:hypothetical protein
MTTNDALVLAGPIAFFCALLTYLSQSQVENFLNAHGGVDDTEQACLQLVHATFSPRA